MSKVLKLDDHRPHDAAYFACIKCGKDWVAVVPSAHHGPLECPKCGAMAGEAVNGKDQDFFKRYTGAAKGRKDRDHRTMVLINEARQKGYLS